VSGLINFVRNIGGSILISLTNAYVTQRGQWRQDYLSSYTLGASANFQRQANAFRGIFDVSDGKANAMHLAQGQVYRQLQAQAQVLAHVDVYYLVAVAAVLTVPVAFLLTKNRPAAERVVMME
jgi:DHA2 family multidrug resistance protein